MKAAFLPTAIIDVDDIVEESALVYTHTCNRFLGRPFVDSFWSAAAGVLSLCIVGASSLLLLWNISAVCIVTALITLILAAIFLYNAYSRYKALPTICSLAKVYIPLKILPLGKTSALLHCAWLPEEAIYCSKPASEIMKESFFSLNGNLTSLDKEAEFLRALNGIAETADAINCHNLPIRLIRFSETLANLFAEIIVESTGWKEEYRRYIEYHSPTIEDTRSSREKNVHMILARLDEDRQLLEQARRFLIQQSQGALDFLYSLRDASFFPLDNRSGQLLASYAQVCEEHVHNSLVKHLMFETSNGIREELKPKIDEIDTKYRALRSEITERYKRHTIGAEAEFEEDRSYIQDQIDRYETSLAAYHRQLATRRRRRTRLQFEIQKTKAALAKARFQATGAQVQLRLEPLEPHALHCEQSRQLAWFQTQVQEDRLSSSIQRLEALDDEIAELGNHIVETRESTKRKKDQLQRLELDFQRKIKRLSSEEMQRLVESEQGHQAELHSVQAPLLQIEKDEEILAEVWRSLIDQVCAEYDTALAEHQRGTMTILKYRRKAAEALSENALRALTELRDRIRQSKQQIEGFLWPRELWQDYDTLLMPIWLLVYQTHTGGSDQVAYVPVGEMPSFTSRSHETLQLSSPMQSLPGADDIVQSVIEAHSQTLAKYVQSKSVIANTMYLTNYLPAWIKKLRKQKRIDPLLAILALIDLRRQRSADILQRG